VAGIERGSDAHRLYCVHRLDRHHFGWILYWAEIADDFRLVILAADSHQFTELSARSKLLAVYALTGFANFASVGIQLGGIGAIAPSRRHDLAKLGMKALFIGFLATLINAAVAGLLM
jgi:nucleoside permease NupC